MSLIDSPRIWTAQPDFTARLRPEIARHCRDLLLGNFGANDLWGAQVAYEGGLLPAGGEYGLAYQGDGTDNIAYSTARRSAVLGTDIDFTFVAVVRKRSTSVDSNTIAGLGSTGGGSGNTLFRLIGGASADAYRIQVQDASSNVWLNTDSPACGLSDMRWHCLIVRFGVANTSAGGTADYYADGKFLGSVNGDQLSGSAVATTFNNLNACGIRRGGASVNFGAFDVALFAPLFVKMPEGWCREHSALDRVWDALFWPEDGAVLESAGGAADLTVAEASHTHAADALSLTTASTLTIADATHAHTADAPALTSASTLVVADALHGHVADGLSLTTESLLALQDALHDHAAEAPELLAGSSLLIAEALQAHTADGLALSVDAYLTVADAGHGHTADALVLTVPSTGADPAAVWSYVLSNGKTAEENVVEILAKLQALHDIHGLTLGSPLTVSATARAAGTISQTISTAAGTTTVTRVS